MAKQKKTAPTRDILQTLETRFRENPSRHKGLKWEDVESRLKRSPKKLEVLTRMEETGGEPDVIGFNKKTGEYLFCDCSPETPIGRRSTCYDRAGLESRKEHRPKNNAVDLSRTIGAELLNEDDYRALQKLGEFDLKTSSWIQTPAKIRKLGGALFCDRRYGEVFVYHNGAQSYYSSRGFRCLLNV